MTSQHTPVSVVVTAHNSGAFLHHCLSSLASQTLRNLQVVIINDASPDERDEELALRFVAQHGNAKYLRNELNLGTGHSRELAIAECEGEYVGFLDSDDFVEPYAFELLYDTAKRYDAHIAVADFVNAPNWNIETSRNGRPTHVEIEVLSGIELFDSQINRINRPFYLRVDWWNKIYKRSLFLEHHVELPHVVRNEGTMSMIMSLLAKTCCIINHPVFYTTSRPESVCRTFRRKNIPDIIASTLHFKHWLRKLGFFEKYRSAYLRFFMHIVFPHNVKLISRLERKERDEHLVALVAELKDNKEIWLDFLEYINLKDKDIDRLLFGTINTGANTWDILKLAKSIEFFDRLMGERAFRFAKNGERIRPTISIVTVCKDVIANGRRRFFEKMLGTVAAQTYDRSRIEHIVIDGASRDGTVEYLKKLHAAGKIDYWVSEPDTGIYNAMNKGAMHSHGTYLLFLNTDDYLAPTALSRLIEAIENTGADYAFGHAVKVDEAGRKVGSHRGDMAKVYFGTPYCHQTLLCARRCFDDCYFDENFRITMWSQSLRLHQNGYRHASVADFVAYFRVGGVSTDMRFADRFKNEQTVIKRQNIVSKLPITLAEYEYLNHKMRKWPVDSNSTINHSHVLGKLAATSDKFAKDFLNAYRQLTA